jgi:hypothetical protein
MNKQFSEPTYFEIHYNNDFKEANIVFVENGQKKGFHVKDFEYTGRIHSVWAAERPTFRMGGYCISIRTKGDKTIIE